ncbi:MAG: aldolase [Herpetosiphonaceae bacterium]|nr:MAG: aldolase [Herpetosiphonaceae bacterium]
MQKIDVAHAVEQIALVGRLLHSRGIFWARAGNISARLPDGTILITRGGTHKALLDRSKLILIDAAGALLESGRPSSETPLHLAAYRTLPAIGAVLHAHPPACTALAIEGRRLEVDLVEEGRAALGAAPLLPHAERTVVAEAWASALTDGARAALLAGHGVIVAGSDLEDVLAKVELCEFIAELQWRLRG